MVVKGVKIGEKIKVGTSNGGKSAGRWDEMGKVTLSEQGRGTLYKENVNEPL